MTASPLDSPSTPASNLFKANPFKELRLDAQFTIELMAAKVQISKQALIRLEQGCYVDPLPVALQYYASAFPITEYELVTQYAEFQTAKRAKAHKYFGDIDTELMNLMRSRPDVHPMRVLRGLKNPTRVAKDLCIPQATLTYFERNVIQQKSVPKVILNVLHEIGYDDTEISFIMDAYESYRQHMIRSRVQEGKRVDYGYVRK